MSLRSLAVIWLVLVNIPSGAQAHSTFQRHERLLAFAGGGFGGSSSKKTKKKAEKKRKRMGLTQVEPSVKRKEEEEPILDKWGLPPPTDLDLFPPMPPGTELIAAPKGPTSLQEIQDAMKDHIPLAFDNFDSNGVERSPSPGNPPMKLKLLHKSPPVLGIENFFTVQECDETRSVATASSVDTAAMQVSSATFSPLAQSKRTSTSWFCHYAQMPTLLAKAHSRLGIPLLQMEEPQIVRYRTGEQFSWHYDEVPPTQLDNGGQRIATLLVYLNDVSRGGGTIFRDLCNAEGDSLVVQPVQGSALLFFPALGDGTPDDRTLHKGEVALDEKWITQMWIHQHEYSPVVPPGNSHEAAQNAMDRVSQELGYQQ